MKFLTAACAFATVSAVNLEATTDLAAATEEAEGLSRLKITNIHVFRIIATSRAYSKEVEHNDVKDDWNKGKKRCIELSKNKPVGSLAIGAVG